MPNIRDVASEAGVSTATVSRVINSPDTVLPSTRDAVNAAIRRLGYRPNDNRRTSRVVSRTILVVMPDFNNMYLIDVLSGINEAATRYGYSLLLYTTNWRHEQELEALKLLERKQADGVILLCSTLDGTELLSAAASYPLIQCCEYHPSVELPHISINNYQACRDGMDYLIKMDYRNIAIISSSHANISSTLRVAAYRDAIQKHGFHYPPGWLRRCPDDTLMGGYETMQSMLKHTPLPNALIAPDIVAIGAIHSIHEAGLRIPEDIAVLGIDGLDLCSMVLPSLSTISQPRNGIGQSAVDMLIRQITGETNQQSVFLPHELIVRSST